MRDPQTAAAGTVLVLNAGSSSLKFGLYPREGEALRVGEAQGLEPDGHPRLLVRGAPPRPLPAGEAGFTAALEAIASVVSAAGAEASPCAVAHRIVHGGAHFTRSCRLDEAALRSLDALGPLAPLHQPHNLAGVRAAAARWPALPQVGCFDTGFHATLPEVETRLPLPASFDAQGVRRYGFHGLSYRYVAGVLARRAARPGGRVLMAHLGNGSSLCAMRDGRSVATTMGFSALEGLMMGTRSGSLDPGVVLHLWREGRTREEVEDLLYRQSGLKGVSGLAADMRTLRASDAPGAHAAIALYTHRVVREAGALAALLGGLDAIAFTGGIGEHDTALRREVAGRLAFLGLRLDDAANDAATGDDTVPVHATDSGVEVWVVPTDEGRVAARDAFEVVDRRGIGDVDETLP